MISQLRKFRSAPAVSDLGEIKKIIKSLEYQAIPYSYLDSSNLKKLEKTGKLRKEVSNQIGTWKERNNIKHGAGFLAEIVHLLRVLNIIQDRKIRIDELENYLEPDGPSYSDFISSDKISVQELTKQGYAICDLITDDVNESKKFDVYLFWLFLRNDKLVPIWQYLIIKPEVFKNQNITAAIKSIENDSFTISSFVRWSDYFNLCRINHEQSGKILDEKKVALKFLHATIIELNNSYIGDHGYHVEDLVKEITEKFHLSTNSLNFYNILERIFLIDNKKSVEGSFTGRGEKTLPNFPKINKLKIRSKIELFPQFSSVKNSDLSSFINIRI